MIETYGKDVIVLTPAQIETALGKEGFAIYIQLSPDAQYMVIYLAGEPTPRGSSTRDTYIASSDLKTIQRLPDDSWEWSPSGRKATSGFSSRTVYVAQILDDGTIAVKKLFNKRTTLHASSDVFFSADETAVYWSDGESTINRIDIETLTIKRFHLGDVKFGYLEYVSFTPDGQKAIVVVEQPTGYKVYLSNADFSEPELLIDGNMIGTYWKAYWSPQNNNEATLAYNNRSGGAGEAFTIILSNPPQVSRVVGEGNKRVFIYEFCGYSPDGSIWFTGQSNPSSFGGLMYKPPVSATQKFVITNSCPQIWLQNK